jgi:hypothetical protein
MVDGPAVRPMMLYTCVGSALLWTLAFGYFLSL